MYTYSMLVHCILLYTCVLYNKNAWITIIVTCMSVREQSDLIRCNPMAESDQNYSVEGKKTR